MAGVEVDNSFNELGGDKVAVQEGQHVSDARIVVRKTDMPSEMQKEAIEVITDALRGSAIDKDAATKIKQAFDAKYPKSTWHCAVGKHFAASITHQSAFQMFISIDSRTVMLFKSQE